MLVPAVLTLSAILSAVFLSTSDHGFSFHDVALFCQSTLTTVQRVPTTLAHTLVLRISAGKTSLPIEQPSTAAKNTPLLLLQTLLFPTVLAILSGCCLYGRIRFSPRLLLDITAPVLATICSIGLIIDTLAPPELLLYLPEVQYQYSFESFWRQARDSWSMILPQICFVHKVAAAECNPTATCFILSIGVLVSCLVLLLIQRTLKILFVTGVLLNRIIWAAVRFFQRLLAACWTAVQTTAHFGLWVLLVIVNVSITSCRYSLGALYWGFCVLQAGILLAQGHLYHLFKMATYAVGLLNCITWPTAGTAFLAALAMVCGYQQYMLFSWSDASQAEVLMGLLVIASVGWTLLPSVIHLVNLWWPEPDESVSSSWNGTVKPLVMDDMLGFKTLASPPDPRFERRLLLLPNIEDFGRHLNHGHDPDPLDLFSPDFEDPIELPGPEDFFSAPAYQLTYNLMHSAPRAREEEIADFLVLVALMHADDFQSNGATVADTSQPDTVNTVCLD
ncbi:hypothetical protein MVEN_02425400 [Mycena venus]|uniref:Uncharacterized protein n=1 Tax=Mycena venus TaxID=2733690 RepID=A0A8H6WYE3_9AGAR|nr:hypothetical protein MVEN_02425400 [Mycena venus]